MKPLHSLLLAAVCSILLCLSLVSCRTPDEWSRWTQLNAIVAKALSLSDPKLLGDDKSVNGALGITGVWDADIAALDRFSPAKLPKAVRMKLIKGGHTQLRLGFYWQPTKRDPIYDLNLNFFYKDGVLENRGVNRTTLIGDWKDSEDAK
jgi:hypothetical protein